MSAATKQVWVNGDITLESEVPLSASAPGISMGMGVFDSLCAYEGVPFDFARHYQRLAQSAAQLELSVESADVLYQALLEVIKLNSFETGKCRLRVTVLADQPEPICIVSAAPFPQRGELSSCVLGLSKVNAYSPLAGIKSTCYALNFIELQQAQKSGADEAILLNTDDQLCEGATSNIFLVKQGCVLTPPLSSGCLPGVAREVVLELCADLGIEVLEKTLTKQDLLTADEAFLTSSLREVQAISRIDGSLLWDAAGKVTIQLKEAYQQRIDHGSE